MKILDPQKGNKETVLVKHGYLFTKTWRVMNVGKASWPKGVKLISTHPALEFTNIKLNFMVKTDMIVDITVVFEVPEQDKF